MKTGYSCSTQRDKQDGSFLGDFERDLEKIASVVVLQEAESLISTAESYYGPLKDAMKTFADPQVPEGWGDARFRNFGDLVSALLLTLPKQEWPEANHVPEESRIIEEMEEKWGSDWEYANRPDHLTKLIEMREIFFENYRKVKNLEARTMLQMTIRDYIPAVTKYLSELATAVRAKRDISDRIDTSVECDLIDKLSTLLAKTYQAYNELDRVESVAIKKKDEEAAFYYKKNVIPKMEALRRLVDAMEVLTAREFWPVPTYGDILFRV